jgi:CheY-like chemotaxis protein
MASHRISRIQNYPPSRFVLLSIGVKRDLLTLRNEVLRSEGYNVRAATSASEALHLFDRGDFDLVVMCHSLPEEDKLRVLTRVKKIAPLTPVVIVRLDGEAARQADASVHSLDGADAFLKCVAGLLARAHEN